MENRISAPDGKKRRPSGPFGSAQGRRNDRLWVVDDVGEFNFGYGLSAGRAAVKAAASRHTPKANSRAQALRGSG